MSQPPPILLIKAGDCRRRDLDLARKAGILVIESKDPASVRFIDAPIAKGNLARVADAMVRDLLAKGGHLYADDVRTRLIRTIMAAEPTLSPPVPEGAKA